jgi:hypothetical protein
MPSPPMTLSPQAIRRFVKRALVDATGAASPDRAQLAGAFDTLCGSFRDRLQPLFGSTAVNALFVRAVHLATAEFGWLNAMLPKAQDPCAFVRADGFDGLDTAMLQDGLAAVLAHNIELLTAFVGPDLVLPLVQQAWGTATVVDAAATEDDQ